MEDLNTLIGAVASLTGDPAAGSISAFIKALAEKEKLIDLGRSVLDRILNQKPEDYSGRVDQMKAAYGTIYFTAFFDELDQKLPKDIRCSIQLSQKEKNMLSRYSTPTRNAENAEKLEIVFPDIVYGYATVDEHLEELYQSMVGRVKKFVKGLAFQDTATEKDIRTFDKVMDDLPEASIKRFHDQYLVLCDQFHEFYIFTQMEREKEQTPKWEDRYKTILSIAMRTQDSAEAGLANLEKIVVELPNQIKKEKVQEIVDELIDTYRDSIDHPLIETKDSDEKLTYPLISKAFIPQAYQLLRYSGKEHLEEPETWKNLIPEQDMMSFWAKYYLDPGSVENLLLILGEPGGGKSLLTKILCARMIASTNIFIRIPLREYDMEDEIESIICRQIEKDGDASESIPTFKWFAEEFQGNPMTLLFDGYDEVMQATGGVYRNLLMKIQRFQNRCQEQCRPIRVVVTSRETLIDKADIPKNTVVMKLLEFDEPRKEQWINIWNEHNHTALAEAGLKDFSLPQGTKDIEELSGQPLLLLMLAIYDANFETKTNALKQKSDQTESLDRTKLYDELLRRFIRRELRKGPKGQDRAFSEVDEDEQVIMVDEEMKKLGIAALGMFVREKLSLTVGELEDDLVYMKAKVTDYGSKNKKTLKNAEAVFGSFFFIHDSRAENGEDEKEAEFEFLHKTFYEFLVADLILQYLIDTVDDLNELKRSEKRGEAHYWAALVNPDFPTDSYYAALNSACLCTEPEIIQMIAEWKDSKLHKYFQGKRPEFGGVMNQVTADLLSKHTTMIRTKIFTPFTLERSSLVGDRSYLQACAIYLMNLLILRILTGGQCRLKIEEWSYISQFLKLNAPPPQKQKRDQPMEFADRRPVRKFKIAPSEEVILKFMALFQIQQEGEYIILTKRVQTGKFERENLQKARMDVFDFIQDNVTWKVYQLHNADSSLTLKQQYRHELDEQGFDLDFELAVAKLHEVVFSMSVPNIRGLEHILQPGIECLSQNYVDASLVLDWLLCIRLLINKVVRIEPPRYRSTPREHNIWEILADIIFHRYIDDIEIVFTYLEIIKRLGNGKLLLKVLRFDDVLIHFSRTSPDLVDAFFEAISYTLNGHVILREIDYYEHYRDIPDFSFVRHMDSPKAIAAVLKFFYMNGDIAPSHPILQEIQSNWDQYLRKAPEELPVLLQTYLLMGKYKQVKGFLRSIVCEKNDRLLNGAPWVVDKFLDVAQAVGEDRNFSEHIMHYIKDGLNYTNTRVDYPHVIMKLLRYSVWDRRTRLDVNMLSHIFLNQYPDMLYSNPEEAVYLLSQISSKELPLDCRDRILKACIFSLEFENVLLDVSLKSAITLLTLCEAMIGSNNAGIKEFYGRSVDISRFSTSYAMRCINKALSTRNRVIVSDLMKFLDGMNSNTKRNLSRYFREQLPYLRTYSWKLAEKIEEIYGLA